MREMRIITTVGTLPSSRIMQAVVARQPTRVWPSAPMFQKRILKAGVTAREMPSRTATLRKVTQIRREVPNAPERMVPYTLKGFLPVRMVVIKPQKTKASSKMPPRISSALDRGSVSRLEI